MSCRHAAGTSLCSNDGEVIRRNQELQFAIVRKSARLRPAGDMPQPSRPVPPTPFQSTADDRRRRHVRVVSVHVGVSDWVAKQGEMVARYVDLPFSLYTSANDSLKVSFPYARAQPPAVRLCYRDRDPDWLCTERDRPQVVRRHGQGAGVRGFAS